MFYEMREFTHKTAHENSHEISRVVKPWNFMDC